MVRLFFFDRNLKRMKNYILVVCCLLFNTLLYAQQSAIESSFRKIEKAYEKGDYKNGFKTNQGLITKLSTNNGLEIASAHFLAAQGSDLMGKFGNYHYHIETGNKLLSQSDKNNTQLYLKALIYAADAYMSYGDFVRADTYLTDANTLLEKGTIKDTALVFDLKERTVRVHFEQGFYLKAQNKLPAIIEYRKSILGKYAYLYDTKKSRYVKKKLSKQERVINARKYALSKDLEAEINFKNGDYESAATLSEVNEDWIRHNIGKKDIAYVNNQFLQGTYYEEHEEYDEANRYYIHAEKFLLKTKYGRYKSYSREAMEVTEFLTNSYSNTRHSTKYYKKKRLLEKKVKKYYGKDNYYYAKVMMLSARKNLFAGNWVKSIDVMNDVLKNYNMLPDDHLDRAMILEDYAQAQLETNNYREVLSSLEASVKITKSMLGEKAPLYHMQQLYLANYYVAHTDSFSRAEEIYKTSLWEVVSKELNHRHNAYLGFLEEEISLYQIEDKYDEAYKKGQNILNEASLGFGKTSIPYAVALVKSSDVSIDVGKYAEAEKNLTLALSIIEEKGNFNDNGKLVYALETMARLQIILGNFELAEKLLARSLKIAKKTSNEDNLAIAIEETAMLYIQTGQYSAIETKLLAVIKSKESRHGKENRGLIKPLNYLAYLYYVMGDYSGSEKQLSRSMAISKKVFGDKSIRYAEALNTQALVYEAIGDNERALQVEQHVYDIQVKQLGKQHIVVANTLNELALLRFYNKEKNETVDSLFKQSLEVIQQNLGTHNLLYADVLKNMSLFYLGIGETVKAEKVIDQAYAVWIEKFGESNKHIADYYYIKGNIDFVKADYINANNEYISSKNIYQNVFNNQHPDYIKALGKSAQMQYILGDYKTAIVFANETVASYLNFISSQFPSLSEREKTKSWNVMRNDFEFYYSMAVTLKDQNPELLGNAYNISMYTKALLLSSSVKLKHRILNSGDTLLVKRYQTWISKKELLSQLYAMNTIQLQATGYDVKVVEKDVEDLEKVLSESSELFAENYEKKTIDWKELRKVLAEDEISVDIIRYRKFDKGFTDQIQYAALSVSASTKTNPEVVVFSNGKLLESKFLKYYRNCIRYNIQDQKSFEMYWSPIKNLVGNKKVVYLSPEGVFNQINLETIPLGDGSYVIDEKTIVLLSNMKDLLLDKYKATKSKKGTTQDAAKKTIVLVGNPKYYSHAESGRLQQLPGAEEEVKEISETFKSKNWNVYTYLFDKADEVNIKKVASPNVFHIATHGFFLEDVKHTSAVADLSSEQTQNPLLRSGLILENGGGLLDKKDALEFNTEEGILTAYEAMNLNFDHTDLVVLSACETGLGDLMLGEGVYGLQRSFMVAGAHNVIMSLFKVPDEPTKQLMVEFYKQWLEIGDKRLAFLKAKKMIMKNYPEPINWGAFVLIGL